MVRVVPYSPETEEAPAGDAPNNSASMEDMPVPQDDELSLEAVPGTMPSEEREAQRREPSGSREIQSVNVASEPFGRRESKRGDPSKRHSFHGASASLQVKSFNGSPAGRISEQSADCTIFQNASSVKNEAIDCQPPSMSAINQLANVLKGQFGDGDEVAAQDADNDPQGARESDATATSGGSKSSAPDNVNLQMQNELESKEAGKFPICSKIVENRVFMGFFMTLTFYALFVPDLDNLLGSKDSKHGLSIITTGVLFLFLVEIVLQCLGRKNYVFRAYFWLDMVASLSLLPDTYFAQTLLGNSFAAGRTTRLTRFIRVASRSSKATRLNRLMRIVRVASLMPKVGALFGRGVGDEETEKVVVKKLRRVFTFLDEDLDGLIPRSAALNCSKQFKASYDAAKSGEGKWAFTQFLKNRAGSTIGFAIPKTPSNEVRSSLADTRVADSAPGSDELTSRGPGMHHNTDPRSNSQLHHNSDARTHHKSDQRDARSYGSDPRSHHSSQSDARSHHSSDTRVHDQSDGGHRRPTALKLSPGMLEHDAIDADQSGTVDMVQLPTSKSQKSVALSEDAHSVLESKTTATGGDISPGVGKIKSGAQKISNAFGGLMVKPKKVIATDEDEVVDEDTLVSFAEFKVIMLQDPETSLKIKAACKKQLQQSNNLKNMSSRHAEFIAVKVALGVLLLLFVLGIVEPSIQDLSSEKGLEHLDELVAYRFPSESVGAAVPQLVRDQVEVWRDGVGGADRRLLYLDMRHKVYCSQLTSTGQQCNDGSVWYGERQSLDDIDEAVADSDYRVMDLVLVLIPDYKDRDMSDEERNELTETVAVVDIRDQTQEVALMSILTTLLVIAIILSGICLLTRDLTFVSRNLLRPLRELADDMESIAQLQLAGVAEAADETEVNQGTSEVRLIRRTFENMKKAIKSWGKYVPWPVVQLMLRANVEANLEVNETEVTIFFSDIANFTTIVESLPPESSLLLLSRYFNDMSKVIDDHGGVVLEFIGDAILCIYGAPLNNPEHPSAAVRAGLKMMASLKKMNEWSRQRDLPEVKIRCGVHTGRVLVGNMGFHSRMKYGIVGEEAHIPSKLEELNKNYSTGMLISSHTLTKIGEDFVTRPVDCIRLKKAPSPGELIHEVIAREKRRGERTHPMWPVVAIHAEAMDLYLARRFTDAVPKLEEVSVMVKEISGEEDPPSMLLLKRCRSYIENPPTPEWDGVWDRGEV